MVTPARFERATSTLGGWRSIQLSYGANEYSQGYQPTMSRPKAKGTKKSLASNKAGYVSAVPGVYYRDDGRPKWMVRLRSEGRDYLPPVNFPVDPAQTNKSHPAHRDMARMAAEAFALKEQRQMRENKKPEAQFGQSWTLEALIERVLEDFESGKIEHKSRSVVAGLRTWIGKASRGQNQQGFPSITRRRLTELKYKHFYSLDDAEAFNNLLKDKAGQKASGSSIKKMLKALQYVFKRARDVYEIDFPNPLPSLKDISANDARERTLTENEFSSIIKAMTDGKTYQATIDVIRFARYTAVRRSEAVKLNWSDINFVDKTAHLRGTKAKRGAYRERVIPLQQEAMEVLKGLFESTEDKKGPVFAYVHGKAWRRVRADTTTQAWTRARQRVAIDKKDTTILTARLHDLRHTRITELGSIPALTVTEAARISGHTDLRTFMRYFNPNPVEIGKKLDDYERAKLQPSAGRDTGTVEDAIEALLALRDKDMMYVALGKAIEKVGTLAK